MTAVTVIRHDRGYHGTKAEPMFGLPRALTASAVVVPAQDEPAA